MLKPLLYLTLLLVFLIGCNSTQQNQVADSANVEIKKTDSIGISDGGIPIFYNMYLSVEMTSLFQSIGAIYNPAILNSAENARLYDISTDKAINLGVYAVDLCYAKYFDQFEQAGKYLKNMQKLSSELGIPSDKFLLSLKRIENNLTNKDSLVKIANDIYKTTEDYLKQSERGSSAALVIAGGWVEAMYIATTMVKKTAGDQELIDRIAEQKQSINNLISLLESYKKEPVVLDLIIKLNDIKSSIEKLNVAENEKELYVQLTDVAVKISSLRKEMIN